jgi:hypothetical protein
MARLTMPTLIFAGLLSVGACATLKEANEALLESFDPKLSPPLKDVKSNEKFFGHNGDYLMDKRPAPDKSIMAKLKGPDTPYPALQSKADFDTDYVKDENSDAGAWKAQFEYEALRKKLAEEQGDVKRAEDKAAREGKDADAAQKEDDEAGKKVSDAQKSVDEANKGESDAKTAEDFKGPPTDEKLKELKKAVDAAEEKLVKQQKAFEECEKQLAAAKKELEDLKAAQKDMEAKLSSDTKLWVEQNQKQKAIKLNLKKNKEQAAFEKTTAAQKKLTAAEEIKATAEKALAKEKAESDKAQANLKTKKAALKIAQDQLQAASTRLQKLHGYTPADAAHPVKSSAQMTSAFMAVLTVVGMFC